MQSEKMCVVLLFGGMSSEHEVSRVSVGNFVNNIDREKYEVLTVGITKEGRWLYTEATAAQMADGSWEELAGNMACVISPDRADHGMILFTPEGHVEKVHVDVVIRCCTACGARMARCRACWSWPASPTWAAACWQARCAWTKPWPMLCSRPTVCPTPDGWLPTAGRSSPIWRRVRGRGKEAGLARVRQARKRRFQRGHLQGVQP